MSNRRQSRGQAAPTSPISSRSRPSYPRHASTLHQQGQTAGAPRRRGSSASVASSIGGTLDTAPTNTQENDWSQNAISSLLAPSIVRTGLIPHQSLPQSSSHRPPTAKDIAPVTLTSIPHVESSAFNEYLSQVGPLFESLNRAKAASAEVSDTLTSRIRASENHDEFADVFGKHVNSEALKSPPTSRRDSAFSPPQTPSSGTPRSLRSRRGLQGPTPLSTIPAVYFDENFHLENPRTFDVVSEYSEITPPERPTSKDGSGLTNGAAKGPVLPRKALQTNAILQEKLSWYMDTVEVHLITSIAAASTSFFAALGSLKELEREAADSIQKIRNLRSALQDMDREMALGGLELVDLRRKRENLRKLGNTIIQLCEVVEEGKACEELVEEGNVEEATSRIDGLEGLITGRPLNSDSAKVDRVDLRQLKALEGITEGIQQLHARIGRGFEDRFKDALLTDLRDHVKSVPRRDTLQRFAQATFRGRSDHRRQKSIAPTYLNASEELRSTLLATLAGLNRAGQASHAASAYREAIMREMKGMIRAQLPSSSDDDNESVTSVSTRGGRRLTQQDKSAILARNLRALDVEAMEELLINVYTTVGEALRRLVMQTKVLLDVTVTIDTTAAETKSAQPESENPEIQINNAPEQSSNVREEVTEALDLSSLLGQAVDIVQGQITKVLKVRREENTRLPLEQFLRYFMLNRLFADECEAVSSRSGDALKEVVNAQVKDFLNNLFESQKQQISAILETDRWEPKDFDEEAGKILQRLLDAMNSTPREWTSYMQLWQDELQVPQINGANPPARSNGEKPATRPARIDDYRFFLVSSAQALLPGITTFLHLIAAIPAIAADASIKLLEYLKLFNSRACQLILGAGATKSAGLKNINSKHLALASQACSFVVALMPYIREFVRRQLPAGSSVLAEFDKVKRLFQDHQTSIHEKLVDIMTGRSMAHIAVMKKADFDEQARNGDQGPSKFIEDLCKETGTLHRVLSRHVGELDLKMIMSPIFKGYAEEWGKALESVSVKTEAGKQRLLKDIETLDSRLSKLDDSSDLGQALSSIVKNKQVGEATPSEPKNGPDTNGAAMFDADEETAADNSQLQLGESSTSLRPGDAGGGLDKGHQRKTTVEILGNGSSK
ncbi:MAG: hypothetical protein Q9159_001667 [Coniocarpon cinnabarinum]